MTNKEAIEQLKFLKKVDFHIDTKETCDIAINSIQENTKLKAEIEELELENVCANHIMDKLKVENEKLKELMPKICETCEYEDEIGYEEPCNSCNNRRNWKLKSEE